MNKYLEKIASKLPTFAGKTLKELKEKHGYDVDLHFTTGQGSEYIRTKSGHVLRNKSYHANTGGEDSGVQKWRRHVRFTPKDHDMGAGSKDVHFGVSVQRLMEQGHHVTLGEDAGHIHAHLFDKSTKAWRRATTNDAFPTAVKNKVIKDVHISSPVSKNPNVGDNVVDFDNHDSGVLKSFHAGSPVSSAHIVGK